jgi:hypothetical protein
MGGPRLTRKEKLARFAQTIIKAMDAEGVIIALVRPDKNELYVTVPEKIDELTPRRLEELARSMRRELARDNPSIDA